MRVKNTVHSQFSTISIKLVFNYLECRTLADTASVFVCYFVFVCSFVGQKQPGLKQVRGCVGGSVLFQVLVR